MFNIVFFLRRIIALPYELAMAPFRSASDVWTSDSGRGQNLLLGAPAIVLGLIGVAAICWAEFGSKMDLEKQYDAAAENCYERKVKLFNELQAEMRLNASKAREMADSGADASEIEVGISDDDARRKELKDWQDAEQIYLEKLISLNPENPDYKFRLAIVAINQRDVERGKALLATIAPEDEPGYAKAHLYMAGAYLNQKGRSRFEQGEFSAKALKHAEHCLVRDKANIAAKRIKGTILKRDRQYIKARAVYEDLFEQDPRHFLDVVEINEKLEETDKNSGILERAEAMFIERTNDRKLNSGAWSSSWDMLVKCLHAQEDFEKCEKLLVKEVDYQSKLIEELSRKEKDSGDSKLVPRSTEARSKRVFVERLLSFNYSSWAESLFKPSDEPGAPDGQLATRTQLDLLRKAFAANKTRNPQVLRLLARIGAMGGPLAAEALEIYDPTKDKDAPAPVLSELGTRALLGEKYEDAISYFERARNRSPNNPMVLNNLAYAYLECENQNPDRALQLVDSAINNVNVIPDSQIFLSHFYDTRGRALMALDPPRIEQAIASFEYALKNRPDNREILLSLIKCYEGDDSRDAEVYRKRLAEIDRKQNK